jgi:hypothetical protein
MAVPPVRRWGPRLQSCAKQPLQAVQEAEAGVQPDAPEPLDQKNRSSRAASGRYSGVPHQADGGNANCRQKGEMTRPRFAWPRRIRRLMAVPIPPGNAFWPWGADLG